LHARGTRVLKDCIVGPEVDSLYDMGPIHICFVIGPQSKLCKEIGDGGLVAYILRHREPMIFII